MRRPRWSHVVIAVGLIAAIAIAVPAFGIQKSLKKAIRKEVSRQIGKATGPQGAPGTPGAAGTARAYARVLPHGFDSCSPVCTIDRAKGITSVNRVGVGQYCVTASSISALDVPAAVTVDRTVTTAPEGNTTAMISHGGFCATDQFKVLTERQPQTDVRNAAGDGPTSVAGNAIEADNVGFTIIIP